MTKSAPSLELYASIVPLILSQQLFLLLKSPNPVPCDEYFLVKYSSNILSTILESNLPPLSWILIILFSS